MANNESTPINKQLIIKLHSDGSPDENNLMSQCVEQLRLVTVGFQWVVESIELKDI